MTKIIALTGSIATGKSFVSNIIKNELNYPLIDADKLARKVVEVSKPCYNEIVKNFGENILNSNKELNRRELRKIIFNDIEKKRLLNSITHKYIKLEYSKKVNTYKKQGVKIIFYDIPLLFEAKLQSEFYKIILVYIPQKLQIKRLINRDKISYENAMKAINSQISIEKKRIMADFIIDNSKNKEYTYKQLVKTIDIIKEY